MLTHSRCGMPVEPGESHDPQLVEDDIMGLFCTVCTDRNNWPLEILDEEDLEFTDLEVLQK